MSSRSKGDYFETLACDYLQNNGFKIITRNYYAKKFGEIDIVASKNNVYHFVEVKSGASFEAVYNITNSKLSKLYKSIDYYLKQHNLEVAYCVDAIIFSSNKIEFLENITL